MLETKSCLSRISQERFWIKLLSPKFDIFSCFLDGSNRGGAEDWTFQELPKVPKNQPVLQIFLKYIYTFKPKAVNKDVT